MNYAGHLRFEATVQHTLIRKDGSRQVFAPHTRILNRSISFWHRLWQELRKNVRFFAAMTFATFLLWATGTPQNGMWLINLFPVGIVTSAGINYLATTFTNNTNPLINFNYHSYGTGDVQGSTSSPTAATAATPIVVTQNGHPFFLADIIKLTGITGITGINGIWQLSAVSANNYTLLGSVGGGSSFGGGTNAAQRVNGQSDTALTTEVSGLSRVAGTQTNPASNSYRSVATVPFTGTTPPLTIIEWGIFSAASSGTLWDRRWMNTTNSPSTTATAALVAAPITITSTADSIQTTYTLTVTAGGS